MHVNLRNALVGFVLLMAGCAHEGSASVARVEPAPAAPPSTAAAESPPPAAAPRSCTTDSDCSSAELCVASQCKAITPDAAECTSAVTHFGFDQYTLQEADFPALQRAARCLSAARSLQLKVDGYADERGTAAYNVALGERRAAAVQKYLVTLGAPADQIRTTSYGKEHPVCQAHTEGCWAQNRRAEVERSY